jgi:hypothetical protein
MLKMYFFKKKKTCPIGSSLAEASNCEVNLDLHLLKSKLQKNSVSTQQSLRVTDVSEHNW